MKDIGIICIDKGQQKPQSRMSFCPKNRNLNSHEKHDLEDVLRFILEMTLTVGELNSFFEAKKLL